MQVKRELAWLYAQAGAVIASCVGGMDMRDERRSLDRGAHIVVATPGRLRDHIMRGSLDMTEIRAIVLDEADEMLDLGFREDLEFILGKAPETRRTLMFSATVPASIAKLAKSYQKDAVRVTTVGERAQHADIEYRALSVAPHDAENALINVLRYYEAPNALVFANTRAMVTRLTTRLSNRGFSVVALSGELSQTERTHALQAMRDGRARVCVATDVAARGIDLPNLELVIHAELPSNSEVLLHRSGRTGRAGRKGVSALIVPPKLRRKADMLLRGAKVTAEWAVPPTADEVLRRDEERLLSDPVWTEEFTEAERDFAARLTALHGPDTVAAAYLRLFANRASAPEDLSPSDAPAAPRPPQEFGPSRWFSVNVGRNDRAEARWLLPLLCNAGGITKDAIGAIRIRESETFVEISESHATAFQAALGPDMALEGGARLTALAAPPNLTERKPRSFDGPKDGPKPVRARPRDDTPPPPSAPAPFEPPVLAQPAPEPVRKPRHTKPAPRDHGEALKAYKAKPAFKRDDSAPRKTDSRPPYKASPDPDRPAHKAKSDAGKAPYKGKPEGAKAPYKGKPEGPKPFKGKPDGAKAPYKGRPDGTKPAYKGKPDGARPAYKGKGGTATAQTGPAAPRTSAADTSKRFTPPGKSAPLAGKPGYKARGGSAPPRRGPPKPR
jgi:ATP-dependent RNA helicase DeaD